MEPGDIPDSDGTAEELIPLRILIVQALEHGEQRAHEVFSLWGRKIERTLFNSLVRFNAAEFLRDRQESFIEYAQEKINNNGISVIFSGFQCKVLKETYGHISASNLSRARRRFYSQYIQPSLFAGLDAFEDALQAVKANLVILWGHVEKYHIDRLWLVLPKGVTKNQVLAHWQVLLPNPLLASAGQIEQPEVSEIFHDTLEDEIQLPYEELGEQEDQDGTGLGQ
jgi:hypothetical protein